MAEKISSEAFAELLAEVNALTARPVGEHVSVLESVQQKLRAALDSDANEAN